MHVYMCVCMHACFYEFIHVFRLVRVSKSTNHCIRKVQNVIFLIRKRPWVPGVISPGRPNDYINLFLEESKTWLKTQLTLDSIHAEELEKRDAFYTKLKNDNYYW